MSRRVCRDCPIPGCGAKYLVRLANHLTDVHMLDSDQRKMYLQEAKLQPKVKCIVYKTAGADKNTSQKRDMVHELSRANRKMEKALAEKRKNSQEHEAGVSQDPRQASDCNNKRSHIKWLSIR